MRAWGEAESRAANRHEERQTGEEKKTKALARNTDYWFRMAIVQGTVLCASELTWNGGVGEHQRAINRTGKSTLGAFRSTPLGIVAAESGHAGEGTV